jgi:RND family efflux transporter MFP subunit
VVHLETKIITDFDEYLASLTSRQSITLYPQVSGYIRSIHVQPGASVKAGARLITIDPGQQDGLLRSLQANVETRKASLAYAIQNDESSQNLLKAGMLGQLDAQQRHSQRVSAEADVRAAEAQLNAQSALLRFYSITAPINGVVGDIPVKVGDYVEPQTLLTSLDEAKMIEAYVYVPITKAGSVTRGTAIQLVDDGGRVLCESKASFISPQVNVDTQTVLVKTLCPNNGSFRAAQVLQARVIWSRHSGVTIPVAAVTRQSGQYFAWVVDHSGKSTVAKQRAIEVGAIEDNSFVVTKGLEAGTDVVVTNVQKIQDGAPIAPMIAEASAPDGGH